jgi:plastocyanin
MTRTRSGLLAVVAIAAVLLGACGDKSEPGSAESQTVSLEAFDYYFEPTALNVNLSAEVTVDFQNSGSVSHSFTAPDLDVETVSDSSNSTSVTFTAPAEPGSYDFFCKYHPDQMKGTISVGGSDQPVENQPGPAVTTDYNDTNENDNGY